MHTHICIWNLFSLCSMCLDCVFQFWYFVHELGYLILEKALTVHSNIINPQNKYFSPVFFCSCSVWLVPPSLLYSLPALLLLATLFSYWALLSGHKWKKGFFLGFVEQEQYIMETSRVVYSALSQRYLSLFKLWLQVVLFHVQFQSKLKLPLLHVQQGLGLKL